MFRYWGALTITVYFYARMDILIWQRIFETHQLWDLGIGVYHRGWMQGLLGFMLLGSLLFFPSLRRMITFPLSVAILAFSGAEDILYYWLDGRSLPHHLPWLNSNPLLFKPVSGTNLLISAGFWLLVIVLIDLAGRALEQKLKEFKNRPRRTEPFVFPTLKGDTFLATKEPLD